MSSYDPTQQVPPPIDPTQLESQPAVQLPETPPAPAPDGSVAFAETQLAPPPPPPGGYVEPPPPPPPYSLRKDWPIAALALCYVVGFALDVIASPSSSAPTSQPTGFDAVAPSIAAVLLLVSLVGILILDWRGYFSLRGWVRRRQKQSDRVILGILWVLFFIIFLPIYFVRRFMGKPQEGLPMPDLPVSSWAVNPPMTAPMQPPGPYAGPYSGPISAPVSGPVSAYMSGPVSVPPPGYGPAQPPMPVYMNPAMPPAAPPQVVMVQGAQPQPAQLIRTYKGGWHAANQKFQKDAKHLAREGWRVQQVVTTQTARAGMYVGFGVGVSQSKAKELTVIYTR